MDKKPEEGDSIKFRLCIFDQALRKVTVISDETGSEAEPFSSISQLEFGQVIFENISRVNEMYRDSEDEADRYSPYISDCVSLLNAFERNYPYLDEVESHFSLADQRVRREKEIEIKYECLNQQKRWVVVLPKR